MNRPELERVRTLLQSRAGRYPLATQALLLQVVDALLDDVHVRNPSAAEALAAFKVLTINKRLKENVRRESTAIVLNYLTSQVGE